VNVRECLPHRSTSAPYPLNNVDSGLDKYIDTTADPFLGDHSCCIGDPQGNSGEWHIAPAGTICYEQAEYGALQGNNDVYKRGSVWRCDGLRGNICAGQKEDVPLQLVDVCADTGGPDGVCSGPESRQAITPEPQQCVNYFGPDFENNACDNRLKCSTQSTYNTASGTRLCRAGCNGNGGCTSPLNWNICESAEQKELLGACSQDLSVSENRVYSMQCSCVQGSGDDAIQCARIDLDTSQAKCVQCGFSWSTDCYGDDSWET
ncbi:hypothetical protein KY316_00820, partial [Candidatus Woesearchaeota archaeon]|nr:hypothetical protein [Candidatus Woesearchaeota archaeon]